jgi:dephospho-CoA kinase
MTPERLRAILAHQTPDPLRRARADHLVRTGLSRHNTRRQILALLERHP